MKQIKNASELKEGQKYLIELEYRYDGLAYYHHFFNKSDDLIMVIKDTSRDTIYEKQEVEFPIVGQEYEFSDDGVGWYKGKLKGYVSHNGARVFDRIRNETINQKELEAIELLKSLGYKVEKL